MSYSRYFYTGVVPSGDKFLAWYDGECVGTYYTWAEANAAIKKAQRA